jgi:hypothetical protein
MQLSGQLHAVDALLPGEYSVHSLVSRLTGPKYWSGGSEKDKDLYVFWALYGVYNKACFLSDKL